MFILFLEPTYVVSEESKNRLCQIIAGMEQELGENTEVFGGKVRKSF